MHWIKQGFVSLHCRPWTQCEGAMVGGKRGKDSTTSRVEKRLCQGNCLEGVLQIKQGGRASCIIYGAQYKVKIWAACLKKHGVTKVLKGKSISFFLWSFLTCHDTFNHLFNILLLQAQGHSLCRCRSSQTSWTLSLAQWDVQLVLGVLSTSTGLSCRVLLREEESVSPPWLHHCIS